MKNFLTSLIVISTTVFFAQPNLNSSLTACYVLNNNANEPINTLTGTLSVVTPTIDRFNNPNSAYYFNGSTSSYIMLPNNSLLKPNEITFSAWVKVDALNSTMDVLFTKNTYSSYFSAYSLCVINLGGGYKFSLWRQNGSGDNFISSTTLVSVNTWYHVAFSMNSTVMKLYVNGVLEGNMIPTITSFNYDPTRYVILGGTNETYNDPWKGTIDNVRFYNRILSAQEVSQLYSTDPGCSLVPVTSFSVFPSTICAGGSIAFTDLSANNPTSWNWQIPGGVPSAATLSNPVVTFPNPGTYVVSMTGSNSSGAGNTATQSIIVKPNPAVSISASGAACLGQSVTLIASGASTYSWSSGQFGSIILVSPVVNTTYTVLASGANGCIGVASTSLAVFQAPVLTVSGTGTICQGQPTSLLVSGTAITYVWSNGMTGNLITVAPVISTVYTVTGSDANGCVNTATQVVFVNSLPPVMANANSAAICSGDPLVLTGSGANTYTWSGGAVNGIPFFPSTMAVYNVTGTGTNGCKNTASIQVVVNPLPTLTHSSSPSTPICSGELITLSAGGANVYNWSTGNITPIIIVAAAINTNYTVVGTDANGCKASFVFVQNVDACTGLQTINKNDNVRVYPNPTTGKLSIESLSEEMREYEVLDLLGASILKGKLDADKKTIDLSNYPKGIYFLKIKSGEVSQTVKIITE